MKINKKIANKIICFLFILTYIFSFSVLHTIIAEEAMPDTEALKSSIRQDAANQTNNIGASATTSIVNTGDDVNVDTSAQNNTRIEVNNQNTANINQNVNAVANTGNNTANRNISFGGNAGVITTGDAEVNVGLLAEVNKNVTKIEEKVAIPTVTPKVTITPTVTPTATPTPSVAGVAVTPTATPTPTAAAVTVTPTAATPTPTGAVAGVAVTPTVTPAPAVGGVAVTQLPAAGSESILLGLIDAFMILFLGVIFKKASKTVINS